MEFISCIFIKKIIMNKLTAMLALSIVLSTTASYAQIKNAKTEKVKVYGNCGMCENTIEKAGSLNKLAIVDWNKDTKIAKLTYDAKQTNPDEILKRIALAGYDSDKFLAPNDVYSKLHECCLYERNPNATKESAVKDEAPKMNMESKDHGSHQISTDRKQTNQMATVLDQYFAVKDALVQTNGDHTATKSAALLTAIKAVEMEKLPMDVHMVWMKVLAPLKEDAEHIADTKDISHQRDHFMSLSKNMYELIKIAKIETPTYYQFCPMANEGKGANWLSKENEIKNPYYGSKMLGCGKTVETIN